MNEKIPTQEERKFREELARVRSLFWKRKIWDNSGGNVGQEVRFELLSEKDQDALRSLRFQDKDQIPPEIVKFVEEIIKGEEQK